MVVKVSDMVLHLLSSSGATHTIQEESMTAAEVDDVLELTGYQAVHS